MRFQSRLLHWLLSKSEWIPGVQCFLIHSSPSQRRADVLTESDLLLPRKWILYFLTSLCYAYARFQEGARKDIIVQERKKKKLLSQTSNLRLVIRSRDLRLSLSPAISKLFSKLLMLLKSEGEEENNFGLSLYVVVVKNAIIMAKQIFYISSISHRLFSLCTS